MTVLTQHTERLPALRSSAAASGLTGALIVGAFALVWLLVLAGIVGQDWATSSGGRWESPSARHWLGTNLLGQDILQRSLYSVRTAFEIGLSVTLLASILGLLIGLVAGWQAGRWPDAVLAWLMGVLDSIPFYLLVAATAFALQGHALAMQAAMVASFWVTTARLVRAEVLRLRQLEFVMAARLLGLPGWRVVWRHVAPHTLVVVLAQSTVIFAASIKAEVILSFLGLGVQDGVSWGLMLAEATQEILAGQFNNLLAATLPLFVLLLGFNLLADGLQARFDPRQSSA